jgi:DNA-binding response OmpR family regulator
MPMTAQPPTALVVEDDEAVRALYVAAFRLRGFLVDEAEFAQVAIDRLSERRYDVLVVDLMLPIESGVYVVDKVRSLPPPRPEIIIITGADSSAVKAIDRSLVRAILFKPINVKALIAYATEVVEEKRAGR